MNDENFITVKLTKEIQESLDGNFDCGNPALTTFVKAKDALDDFFGKTYVLIVDSRLIGYYNIGTGDLSFDNQVRAGGSIYLNCFAVDNDFKKRQSNNYSVSDTLLHDCIKRIEELREDIGFGFITLSSTDEGYSLYKRNGFEELEEDMSISKNRGEFKCTAMYLPLDIE